MTLVIIIGELWGQKKRGLLLTGSGEHMAHLVPHSGGGEEVRRKGEGMERKGQQ